MKIHWESKGFTLVEVIISIGIISMILVSLLSFFAGGFKSIIYNGKRTKEVFEAETKLGDVISSIHGAGYVNTDPDVAIVPSSISIKIYSSDGSSVTNSPVSGQTITVDGGPDSNIAISTFVPDN